MDAPLFLVGNSEIETSPTYFHRFASGVAYVASVSSRFRRESWDESKKKRNDFRAITRLETLAMQAASGVGLDKSLIMMGNKIGPSLVPWGTVR